MDIAINVKDYLLLVFYFFYAVLLPGYLLTRLIISPVQLRKLLSVLPNVEKNLFYRYFHYLFAPAVGLVLVDAVVLVLAKFHWALSFNNFFVFFSTLNILFLALNLWLVRPPKVKHQENPKLNSLIIIFIGLFFASVVLRTIFYLPDAVPGSTDLGHHMYWSQWMVQNEAYPNYDTPEVIEGEHIIFAVLGKLSGITLLSAMPLIVLSFYNLAMLLALSFGSMAITANRKIALWVLFFSGIYFSVDPPQARYIKGGVIGNTFGNLFIPLVFLLVFLFFRYFYKYLVERKKDIDNRLYNPASSLIALILILIAGSFYSHHLSTFLLGIALAVSFIFWIITTLVFCRNTPSACSERGIVTLLHFFRKIFLSPKLILVILAVLIFPLFVYIPHYLANNAVETVTQEPEKDTHLGVSLEDFLGKMGWTRFVLLAAALTYLLIVALANIAKRYNLGDKLVSSKVAKIINKKNSELLPYMLLLLAGWFLPFALLSFYPEIFRVDLPSRRVVNYLVFPSVILAAVAANLLFSSIVKKIDSKLVPESRRGYLKWVVIIVAALVLWDGSSDFRSTYTSENKFQENVELFNASEYIAKNTKANSVMLKDHNKISGDSWIKFFLLRGYDSFLSRTYDYKYNAVGNDLDPCTREMIIVPDSDVSEKCYGQTGINYVIVKPAGEEFLFWKGKGFDCVYVNDDIAIFKRVKN